MVREVIVTNVGAVNADKLDMDIRAAVPTYAGYSRRPEVNGAILIFDDAATDEQIQTAQGIVRDHDPDSKTPEQQLRETIKTTAQSAVGVALNDLTAAQQRALLALLLNKEGAIGTDLTVRPLSEWAR